MLCYNVDVCFISFAEKNFHIFDLHRMDGRYDSCALVLIFLQILCCELAGLKFIP